MKSKALLTLALLLGFCLPIVGCMPSNPPKGWSGPVVANVSFDDSSRDILFYGAMEGFIIALKDIEDRGDREWRYPDESATSYFYGAPFLYDNIVYAAGYSGIVYALDADDGSGGRFYPDDMRGDDPIGSIVGGPVVADGVLYVGASDGNMYAINVTTERLEWAPLETGKDIWATPLVHEGIVYIGSFDHKLYAVDATDGSPAWGSPFETNGAIIATATEYNGSIYIGSCDRKLYAIDAATGEPKEGFTPFHAGNWFWGKALAQDGSIFAGNLDGKVYAIDAESGSEIWTAEIGCPIRGDPALLGGLVIAGAENGKVYAFDVNTGDERWTVTLGGDTPTQVRASLFAHVNSENESVVYIHAANQRIYCVRWEEGEDGGIKWRYPPE